MGVEAWENLFVVVLVLTTASLTSLISLVAWRTRERVRARAKEELATPQYRRKTVAPVASEHTE